VGAEFCVKQVPIPDTNILVELYIFDCGGQSMFNQLEMGNGKYYEDASSVLVVYDVSSSDSLKACGKWLEAVRQMQGKDGPSRWLIGALVGNKKDFRDGRVDSRAEVGLQDAQQMAKSLGLKGFFETSAVSSFYFRSLSFSACTDQLPPLLLQ
jgi:intraflagellar transport protein 27